MTERHLDRLIEAVKIPAGDSGPPGEDRQTIVMADPVLTTPAPRAPAAHAIVPPPPSTDEDTALLQHPVKQSASPPAQQIATSGRICLTGVTGSGRTWLADQMRALGFVIMSFDTPILQLTDLLFGASVPADQRNSFVSIVRAWGNGTISKEVPITPARALFTALVNGPGLTEHVKWPGFGQPGFWTNFFFQVVRELHCPIVVPRVRSPEELAALKAEGFGAWHVMCSPNTLKSRGAKPPGEMDRLGVAVSSDVMRKISGTRETSKLRCVWNDPGMVPSQRLHSVQDFLNQFLTLAGPAASSIAYE